MGERRSSSAAVRFADEVLTFMRKVQVESRHVHSAVAAVGSVQDVKKEGNAIATRVLAARSVYVGLPLTRHPMGGEIPGEPTDVGHHFRSRAWSKGYLRCGAAGTCKEVSGGRQCVSSSSATSSKRWFKGLHGFSGRGSCTETELKGLETFQNPFGRRLRTSFFFF